MSERRDIHGILVLNKPRGLTSHDCVAKVRTLSQTKKVGHTGTLDPEVTGVLPICLGQATRMVEFLALDEKEYVAEIKLGKSTTTEDQTGEIVQDDPLETAPSESRIREVLHQFSGEIEQIPPMYSAVKVNGKRLYEYAFAGQEVHREPRTVTIHHLELLKYEPEGPYPTFSIQVLCSKGTYIRTLGVDLGRALGHPAHMSSLVRTKSGSFSLQDSVTFDDLEQWQETDWQTHVQAPDSGLNHFPQLTLEDDLIHRIRAGQTIRVPQRVQSNAIYRIYDTQKKFVALYEGRQPHTIKPRKVFRV